jgi:hypothetical protein
LELSRPVKLLVGAATLWPLVWMFCFFGFFAFMMFLTAGQGGRGNHHMPNEELVFPLFALLFLLHGLTMFIMIGLLVFYIIHIIKNPALSDNMKILWVLILFFGSIVGMPVYWCMHVWPERPQDRPELDLET